MTDEPQRPRRVEFVVSWLTIFKILTAALLAYLAVRLWPLFQLLFLALLVAITLWPILRWAERRGSPKWVGVTVASLLLAAFVALLVGVLIPALASQGSEIIKQLPAFKEQLVKTLPAWGLSGDATSKLLDSAWFANPEPLLKEFFAWGRVILRSLLEFFVVLIVAIYFLVDGERVYKWLVAFLPTVQRRKMIVAGPEIASVVSNYMAGQLITSLLCGVYVFILLSVLRVPNAALLAVAAGVFDILPLIGFFLSVVPAIAMALTVSPVTAFLVFALYGVYHLVEVYWIVPKVYGNRLRLSTLTVLLSCMAAALVAGVIGAIAILPIVASYPIIERLWLKDRLEPDTIAKHEEIDAEEHPEK